MSGRVRYFDSALLVYKNAESCLFKKWETVRLPEKVSQLSTRPPSAGILLSESCTHADKVR